MIVRSSDGTAVQVPERHVSPTVRLFVSSCGALGVWQLGWVAEESDRLSVVLPLPWAVSFWLGAWSLVAITGVAAGISGRDLPTRVALVVVAVVELQGMVALVADDRPMGWQFWQFGQAAVIVVIALGLVAAPLRTPPDRLHE